MARTTKRTSVLLCVLAAVFVCIIIILCIVPKNDPTHSNAVQQQKSAAVADVVTDPSSTSTSTTTTTTTAAAPTTTTTTTAAAPITTTAAPTTTTTAGTSITTITAGAPIATDTYGGPTTTTTTDGPTPIETTDGPFFSETTDGPTLIETTDGPFSSETTDGPFSSETTDGPFSSETTDGPFSSETTDGPFSSETTDGPTTTTLGLTSDPTTTVSTSVSTSNEPITTEPETTTLSSTEQPKTTTARQPIDTTPIYTRDTSKDSKFASCKNSSCRSVAGNMLAMMSHDPEANACTDFYRYACGGLINNQHLQPKPHHEIIEDLIKGQLKKEEVGTVKGDMSKLYDSCLKAVDQDAKPSWNKVVRDHFGDHVFDRGNPTAGTFTFSLSDTLAHMMKKDFTPFFNMEFEVDQEDSSAFIMSLHPVVPGSPFSGDLARKVCLEEDHREVSPSGDSYDVEQEYQGFMECVRRGAGLTARLVRMEQAVMRLGLLEDMDPLPAEALLKHTVEKAEEFLKALSYKLPSIPELKEALATGNYSRHQITELSKTGIDWETVLGELLDEDDVSDYQVNDYMENTTREMQIVLQDFYTSDPGDLYNILLMLWSERIYTDFVQPVDGSVGEHQYCLHTATALMQDAASYLYLEALSQEEIHARHSQIMEMSYSVRQAGMKMLSRITQDQGQEPSKKLKEMMDVIEANKSEAKEFASDATLSVVFKYDFLHNSLALLTSRRSNLLDLKGETPKEKWWKFMRPYDARGVHSYAMRRIMIPYAAQEPSATFTQVPDYLSYAKLGVMMSNLVWHGYDMTGLRFSSDKYEDIPDSTNFLDVWRPLLEKYRIPQSYKNSNNIASNFSLSSLAENELLADSQALRLAWEAYLGRNEQPPPEPPTAAGTYESLPARRRRSLHRPVDLQVMASDELPLLWLGLKPIQVFYLHWAQSHCSASSDVNMLEVMESRHLPGPIRVNMAVLDDQLFQAAFNCTPQHHRDTNYHY